MTTRGSVAIIAVAVAAILIGPAAPAGADETLGYLAVYQDETAGSCVFSPGAEGYAYVVLTHSLPAREITFVAPKPSFVGTILFESSAFATTGDSQTGITVNLGTCMSPPVTVLTIFHLGVGTPSDCQTWAVGENPASGSYPYYTYEFVDCDGATRQGKSAVLSMPTFDGFCCLEQHLTPYEPYPPDGATNVPTNVTLSWILPEEFGDQWIWVYDGPYPPSVWCGEHVDYFTEYQPDYLQPNTTYYWIVGLNTGCYDSWRSDMWTFTTGDGPVATESSTWGQIKALYQ